MIADIDRLWLADLAERFGAGKANIEKILARGSKSEDPYVAKSGNSELGDDDKWQMALLFDKIRSDIPKLVGIVWRLV